MNTAVLRRLGVSSRPAVVRPPQLLYRCIILPARPQMTGRPAPSAACSKWTKMDCDNNIQSPGETYILPGGQGGPGLGLVSGEQDCEEVIRWTPGYLRAAATWLSLIGRLELIQAGLKTQLE